jgi:hypothetical protein
MCSVCTTKGLYEMNSMSEYPYEDKIHSDDKVNYKTVCSSDRIKMVISLEGAIKAPHVTSQKHLEYFDIISQGTCFDSLFLNSILLGVQKF